MHILIILYNYYLYLYVIINKTLLNTNFSTNLLNKFTQNTKTMKKNKQILKIVLVLCFSLFAKVSFANNTAIKDTSTVKGCMDKTAVNFNPYATVSDNTCKYKLDTTIVIKGCTDKTALNFNAYASIDDNTCVYKQDTTKLIWGCTDSLATNYNKYANKFDGSCIYKYDTTKVWGCMDKTATNYNQYAQMSDGSCKYIKDTTKIVGCMDAKAINFNPFAMVDDKSCVYKEDTSFVIVKGCTDPLSANFNMYANYDDTSCVGEVDISNIPVGINVEEIEQIVVGTVNNCAIPYGFITILSAKVDSIFQNTDYFITYWKVGVLGVDTLISFPVMNYGYIVKNEINLFRLSISCNNTRIAGTNQYTFVDVLTPGDIAARLADITSSNNTTINSSKVISNVYNLQGEEVNSNYKGLVIIRYTDGTTQKVIKQ